MLSVIKNVKTNVIGLTAAAHDQNAPFRLGNRRKCPYKSIFDRFGNFEGLILSTSALRYQKCKNENHRTDGWSARTKRTFPAGNASRTRKLRFRRPRESILGRFLKFPKVGSHQLDHHVRICVRIRVTKSVPENGSFSVSVGQGRDPKTVRSARF